MPDFRSYAGLHALPFLICLFLSNLLPLRDVAAPRRDGPLQVSSVYACRGRSITSVDPDLLFGSVKEISHPPDVRLIGPCRRHRVCQTTVPDHRDTRLPAEAPRVAILHQTHPRAALSVGIRRRTRRRDDRLVTMLPRLSTGPLGAECPSIDYRVSSARSLASSR